MTLFTSNCKDHNKLHQLTLSTKSVHWAKPRTVMQSFKLECYYSKDPYSKPKMLVWAQEVGRVKQNFLDSHIFGINRFLCEFILYLLAK